MNSTTAPSTSSSDTHLGIRQDRNSDLFDNIGTLLEVFGGPSLNVLRPPTRRPESDRKIYLDLVNDEKSIVVVAQIPGVKKDSIDVDFYNNKMTIKCEKKREYQNPAVSEIAYGTLSREITLPICVTKREAVTVSYSDGMLTIYINKRLEEENKFSVRPSSHFETSGGPSGNPENE